MAPTRAAVRLAYYGVERRVPASLLLVTPEVWIANTVYGTLERTLGARVWLWIEPALEPAVRVLGVCRFRLILLDLMLREGFPGSVLRVLRQAAPQTPIALLAPRPGGAGLSIERRELGAAGWSRLSGALAVVPRGDPASLTRVVLQILGIPAARGPLDPRGDSDPAESG
jgi:hypothetical protein